MLRATTFYPPDNYQLDNEFIQWIGPIHWITYPPFVQPALGDQRTLDCDSRLPKKAADKKFQRQNNLAPVLQCFVIDWNGFKQRSKRSKRSKQRLQRLLTVIKGSVLEAYTQTKRADICVACALDNMFSYAASVSQKLVSTFYSMLCLTTSNKISKDSSHDVILICYSTHSPGSFSVADYIGRLHL